jgi:hypothetical protein
VSWWAAIGPLGLLLVVALVSSAAGLWRVSAWNMTNVERLLTTEGLPIGSRAPELTAHGEGFDLHVTFDGVHTFVVFGEGGCPPCLDLISAADRHPALANARLIYVSSSEPEFPPTPLLRSWETIRFHDEALARRQWSAPVSPFYHYVDPLGRVVAKGIASRASHLDHLLQAPPPLAANYDNDLRVQEMMPHG